jgi:chromosome segregation ATPase
MAVNLGCVDYQKENDALKRQLAFISSRRDELERWYSEHVASTAQLRDDLADMTKACNLAQESAVIANAQLAAANARIKFLESRVDDDTYKGEDD